MAQILEKFEKFILPKRGNEVQGKVLQVLQDRILVDFGGKSEGVITGREFTNLKKSNTLPNVGETISAIVVNPEDETGTTILSIRTKLSQFSWEKLEKAAREGGEVEAEVKELARSGILIEVLGLLGFIPAGFADTEILVDFAKIAGKKIKVKILEINKDQNRLVCTQVSQTQKFQEKLPKKFKIGEKYTGIIAAILPFGLVVTFNGENCFVPNPEVSWERIENSQKLFKIGQEVNFVFLGFDKLTNRPQISVKQATPNPWEKISEIYAKDAEVLGTVSRLTEFGAFVTLENGVEGLLHISRIPPDLQLSVGDSVSCIVESIDTTQRRISLSLVLKKKPVGYR